MDFNDGALHVFTDGSSAATPRKGGVGFRILFPDGSKKDFSPPGYAGATNNEMELQAAILALREIDKLKDIQGASSIIIDSDSRYLIDNFGLARAVWPWHKWTRTTGEPVLNVRQWKQLVYLTQKLYKKFRVPIQFNKVKAHSGHEHNTIADKLAKASQKGRSTSLKLSHTKVRKKLSTNQTVAGSIQGEGQRIRLRAITSTYLPQQRVYRCRCEALSKRSKYYQSVDFVISKQVLSAGHTYDVVLEAGLNYCRVKKIIREVIPKGSTDLV